jgi:putative OmpL-like beta-barrel porin-2
VARAVIAIAWSVLLLATASSASAQMPVNLTRPLEIEADLAQAPATPEPAAKEPAEKEAEPDRWWLMDLLKDTRVGRSLESAGIQVYGWIQQGFAGNPDSPHDRVNFGTNLDWRSNDYRLNQVYLVVENTLGHENAFNIGYRVDVLGGHDAPFFVANGLLSDFTGFDERSGVGVNGPRSFREVDRVGLDFPQFYIEAHFPGVITPGGMDLRVGKFYTLMGREVYPAADTDFYSRAYENIYATPFTHTGGIATLHATKTVDVLAGVVRGWDVFRDNNDMVSFHGGAIWNSEDKRYNWTTAWITGPEQPDNDHAYRSLISSYLTAKLGPGDVWLLSAGGHFGHEANAAVDPVTGRKHDARWYGTTINVFYTVGPKLRLGARAEWFRDEDGTRTAQLGRPGFAADFVALTLGLTYKPYRSVSIRPELRFDHSPDARPYNDQTSHSQFVPAIDLIVRF